MKETLCSALIIFVILVQFCSGDTYYEPYERRHRVRDGNHVYYESEPRKLVSRPKTYQTYDLREPIHEYKPRPHTPLSGYDGAIKSASDYRKHAEEPRPYATRLEPKSRPRSYDRPSPIIRSRRLEKKRYSPSLGYESESPRRRSPTYRDEPSSRTYGVPSPSKYIRTSYGAPRSYTRTRDPCVHKYDGQYVLGKEFRKLFPYVDSMCYFTKCANKKAFLNPCSPGTRNDKQGGGFCSYLDLEGYCGHSIYDTHDKKQKNDHRQGSPYDPEKNSYKEYAYGAAYQK